MAKKSFIWVIALSALLLNGCGIYSFSGGQFSGAKTFTVSFFRPQTPLASQVYAQRFTESLKDLLLSQSPLKLEEKDGELRYEGSITEYKVAPVGISAGSETAVQNRLSITVKVKYTNSLEPDLSFEKTFTKFADFDAATDLFTVQENLWQDINDQLLQEIYNASVGNW